MLLQPGECIPQPAESPGRASRKTGASWINICLKTTLFHHIPFLPRFLLICKLKQHQGKPTAVLQFLLALRFMWAHNRRLQNSSGPKFTNFPLTSLFHPFRGSHLLPFFNMVKQGKEFIRKWEKEWENYFNFQHLDLFLYNVSSLVPAGASLH